MIEPSFVDGLMSEKDLVEYWTKSGIPDEVQKWILPRMKVRLEKALNKDRDAAISGELKETVRYLLNAYLSGLISKEFCVRNIISLGYTKEEADKLILSAEIRKKTPSTEKMKRLPLSDYEKCYVYGLISLPTFTERMEGEYDPRDIALELDMLKAGIAISLPATIKPPKEITQGIKITSKPTYAEVWLDKKDTGKLTTETINTTTGKHTVMLRLDGHYDVEYEVTVAATSYVELHVVMEKIEKGKA